MTLTNRATAEDGGVTIPELWEGMTHRTPKPLPHHRLIAYSVAVRLLVAVREARVRDRHLRDQALRAAKSACLNIAEAAGRVAGPDRARAFAIARGEAVEAVAAIEIAAIAGDTEQAHADRCVLLADEVVAMLTALTR